MCKLRFYKAYKRRIFFYYKYMFFFFFIYSKAATYFVINFIAALSI